MVTIEVPDYLIDAAGLTADELRVELAIRLYEQQRLSLSNFFTHENAVAAG